MSFFGKWREPLEPGSRRERVVLGFSLSLGAAVLLLDQLSKVWVERTFALHETQVLIPKFFNLTYVLNYGAAWSILTGYGWLLLVIAALVIGAAFYFFRYLTEGYPERCVAVFLILGGVVGNSIDRIWRGAVVDFFDAHYEQYHWPIFNVADVAICIGVGLFILSSLLRHRREKKA